MSNDYNGKKRSELPDSVFGIPQERKYPMPDEKHTRSAIKLFNHVEPKYEEQLAKAIIKNMKKYGIDGSVVGPNNRLRKYLPKDMIKECIEYVMMDYNVMKGAQFIPKRNSRIYGTYLTEDKTMCYMSTDKSALSESVLCIPILEECSKKNIQIMKDIINDSESEEFKGFIFANISYYKIEYDNDKPIGFGTVRTKLIDDNTIGYVSVLVLPEYRGKGYGTKITEDIIDWFKGERGIDFLEWWYKPDNDASKALANKAGFIEYIATNEDQWKRTYIKNESSLLSESDNSKCNPYQYTVIKFLNREIKPFVLGNKEWRKRAKNIHLTLTFKIHDTVSRYIGVTILDGSQEYRDTDQARHLLKEIKSAIMNYSKHNQEMKLVKRVNLGDGDEGSIYFDLGFINTIIHRSLDAKVVGEQVEDIPTINSSIYLEKAYKDIMDDKYINPIDTGIHTIIFDIGDVLVSSNIEDYLERDPEVPNFIIDELVKLWFVDKDEIDDTLNLEEYKEISIKRMGPEFSKYIPKLFKYNIECVNAFDYTIPMIQDLKSKGYAVYYLSNWSAWTHELLKEAGKFDFLNLMNGGVFSYDAGYRKPDLEIYNILLNKYKIDPKTSIFFDDKKDNIVAANKLGINGYLFDQHDSDLVYYALRDMYARKVTESTIDSNIYLEESTVSEYGTTGGTIVGSNQPDSVYIVNYMQNNAFSGHKEPKFGVCRKGMKDLHIVGGKYNRFHYVSDLDKFKEEASDIHVYRYKGKPKNEFFDIIEEMKGDNDLDLYKLITGREIKDRSEIQFDGDFIEEECFFDTIDAIRACTEAGLLEASTDLHPVPILTETVQGRPYNYYRDLNGVFIQHEITGLRSKSYDTLDDIPDAETEIVKRGYLV